MKNLDKILFVLGLLAFAAGCGVYFGMSTGLNSSKKNSISSGANFEKWEDDFAAQKFSPWSAPEFDSTTGWNYDLFNSPETFWLSSEKRYIAKELPVTAAEPFGVRLAAIENPMIRLRISECSSDFPPKRNKVDGRELGFKIRVGFASASGETSSVDFFRERDIKQNVEKFENRTIVTLTPKKPIEIPNMNAALVNLKIVKGESEDGSGTFFTRYMATVRDRTLNNESVRIVEEFYKNPSRVEAHFEDENSPKQWRIRETVVPGKPAPQVELFSRNSPEEAWKFEHKNSAGTPLEFTTGNDTYTVKILDIENRQATVSKQSDVPGKSRRNKNRQAVLDASK